MIVLSNNPKFYGRIKYIDVRFHWICKAVLMKQLDIIYIPIKKMATNSLTKALPTPGFLEFRRMIDM